MLGHCVQKLVNSGSALRGIAAAVVAGVVLSGCLSPSLEDAVPSEPSTGASSEPATDTASGDNSFVTEGALRNESYPTFEKTPVAATDQLSDSDKSRLEAEMDAARAAYGSGAISEATYRARMEELQTLARTHGDEVEWRLRN